MLARGLAALLRQPDNAPTVHMAGESGGNGDQRMLGVLMFMGLPTAIYLLTRKS